MFTSRIKNQSNPTPLSSELPGPEELAWAAGFIEGEGSFTRMYSKEGKRGFRISASQRNIEPLEKLQKYFGGSIKIKKPKKVLLKTENRGIVSKVSWVWRLYGVNARNLARELFPLLSKRRQNQAMELLDLDFINPDTMDKGPRRHRR